MHAMDASGHELYFAHQRAMQTVHGVVIGYRLALNGPAVTVVHSELDAHVRAWMLEHIDLRAARPRARARRHDVEWMFAWRAANPGRG